MLNRDHVLSGSSQRELRAWPWEGVVCVCQMSRCFRSNEESVGASQIPASVFSV